MELHPHFFYAYFYLQYGKERETTPNLKPTLGTVKKTEKICTKLQTNKKNVYSESKRQTAGQTERKVDIREDGKTSIVSDLDSQTDSRESVSVGQ